MQDEPHPSEILAAVARFLRESVVPATTGHVAYTARVAANALDLSRRQLELAPAAETAERRRLEALIGPGDSLGALNAELARRLAEGEIDPTRPEVRDHLWRSTLDKLAVDQPGYWGYRAALADRGETQTP